MKFAFSTAICPAWDFATIAERAKAFGYDGVEIATPFDESQQTAANPFLTDSGKLHGEFSSAGLEIACLSSPIAYTGRAGDDATSVIRLKRLIDLASVLDCPIVKILDTPDQSGQSRSTVGVALGEWLLPLGDYAADRNVTIAIENALAFTRARDMWGVLDRLQHPAIACCWDVLSAARAGEGPLLSVPTLNSRIVYAQIQDAKIAPAGASFAKLGDGDVRGQQFLSRLRGIGYEDFVTYECDPAWLAEFGAPEEALPAAIATLKKWTAIRVEKTKVVAKR